MSVKVRVLVTKRESGKEPEEETVKPKCVYKSTSLNEMSCLPLPFYNTVHLAYAHIHRAPKKKEEPNPSCKSKVKVEPIRKGNKMETGDIKCGSECIK